MHGVCIPPKVKLFPEQIEKKLQLIIRDRFFVAPEPDKILGEKLIIIIEHVNEVGCYKAYFDKIKALKNLDIRLLKKIYMVCWLE